MAVFTCAPMFKDSSFCFLLFLNALTNVCSSKMDKINSQNLRQGKSYVLSGSFYDNNEEKAKE